MVLNDEEDLKRQQAAERARERQERLRDAYVLSQYFENELLWLSL